MRLSDPGVRPLTGRVVGWYFSQPRRHLRHQGDLL